MCVCVCVVLCIFIMCVDSCNCHHSQDTGLFHHHKISFAVPLYPHLSLCPHPEPLAMTNPLSFQECHMNEIAWYVTFGIGCLYSAYFPGLIQVTDPFSLLNSILLDGYTSIYLLKDIFPVLGYYKYSFYERLRTGF